MPSADDYVQRKLAASRRRGYKRAALSDSDSKDAPRHGD
jgi:hypothetical protein